MTVNGIRDEAGLKRLGARNELIRVRLSRNTLADSELNQKNFEFNVDRVSGPASSACLRLHPPAAQGRACRTSIFSQPKPAWS